MKNFIKTLLDIITNSPSSVLFIVLGTIFAIAMIINIKNKKRIGKVVSILGWLFIILFIITRYSSYLNKLFDNLINNVFMQIFFPNLATYVIIIIVTNVIFLYTIIKKTSNLSKFVNTIFFAVIMIFLVYTLDQIISNKINVYSFEEVYKNEDISVLIQSTTLLFTAWIILIISKLIINKLIQKSIRNMDTENNNAKDISTQDIQPIAPTDQPVENVKPEEPLNAQDINQINSSNSLNLHPNNDTDISSVQNLQNNYPNIGTNNITIPNVQQSNILNTENNNQFSFNDQQSKEEPSNMQNIKPINNLKDNLNVNTNIDISKPNISNSQPNVNVNNSNILNTNQNINTNIVDKQNNQTNNNKPSNNNDDDDIEILIV